MSLSECILDIVRGKIKIEDVEKIITSTLAEGEEGWRLLMQSYTQGAWRDNPGQCVALASELRANGKIVQPRINDRNFLTDIIQYGFWQKPTKITTDVDRYNYQIRRAAEVEQARARRFDRNGYNYADAQLFFATMSQAMGEEDDYLSKMNREHGGKYVGLIISEYIAACDTTQHLRVPPYEKFSIANITNFLRRTDNNFILRSSDKTEDWSDPRSGVYRSYTEKNKRFVTTETLGNMPHIVQERRDGFGLVVDVAYSEIFARPIVRITCGLQIDLPHGRDFISATDSPESRVLIIDPATGKILVEPHNDEPTNLQNPTSLTDVQYNFDMQFFAQTIYRAIQETQQKLQRSIPTKNQTPIIGKFGLQFEIVIDPQKPQEWHLVQTRPTPGQIIGPFNYTEKNQIAALGEELCTSAIVSRPFAVSGEAGVISPESHDQWIPDQNILFIQYKELPVRLKRTEPGLKKYYGLLLKRIMEINQANNATTFIVDVPIGGNQAHAEDGYVYPAREIEELRRRGIQIISITQEQGIQLSQAIQRHNRIGVISDGLAGTISILPTAELSQ